MYVYGEFAKGRLVLAVEVPEDPRLRLDENTIVQVVTPDTPKLLDRLIKRSETKGAAIPWLEWFDRQASSASPFHRGQVLEVESVREALDTWTGSRTT